MSDDIFCPKCEPVLNKKGGRIPVKLEIFEYNYSGCGVDMAECPICTRCFQISYKVDKVEQVKGWGGRDD